eukprot:439671-Amphidinium_carterae.1
MDRERALQTESAREPRKQSPSRKTLISLAVLTPSVFGGEPSQPLHADTSYLHAHYSWTVFVVSCSPQSDG